jgi:hypothetical protein
MSAHHLQGAHVQQVERLFVRSRMADTAYQRQVNVQDQSIRPLGILASSSVMCNSNVNHDVIPFNLRPIPQRVQA